MQYLHIVFLSHSCSTVKVSTAALWHQLQKALIVEIKSKGQKCDNRIMFRKEIWDMKPVCRVGREEDEFQAVFHALPDYPVFMSLWCPVRNSYEA